MQVLNPPVIAAATENKVPTGAMVAWYPRLADRKAASLERDDAETPEEMHVTLAYLGKVAELDETAVTKIQAIVERTARDFGSFPVERSGTGVFETKDDGTCVVALMDSPALEKLQEELVNALVEDGLLREQAHGFTAHMTLVYLPTDEAPTAAELEIRGPKTFTCGSISLAVGSTITTFPFGQQGGVEEFGDTPGHDFHGNQWTNGEASGVKHDLDALKPRAWSEKNLAKTRKELSDTPLGAELVKTLDSWRAELNPKGVTDFRKAFDKQVDGKPVPEKFQASTAALQVLLHAAPPASGLFRGINVREDPRDDFKAGQTIDLGLSSFTSDEEVAHQFGSGEFGDMHDHSVVLVLDEPMQALPIQNLASDRQYADEKEFLGGGKFEVTREPESFERQDGSGGTVTTVHVRQVSGL